MNIRFTPSRRARAIAGSLLLAAGLGLPQAAHAAEGEELVSLVLVDRLEYQTNEGNDLVLWDAQGWIGGDINKFWVKTEGEYLLDGDQFEEAQFQGLYSRAISSFWNLQAGIRHDIKPGPSRTFGVAGVQGLAPQWFEVDAAAFVSEDGDIEARVETEYDLLVTQRLIIQPRAELNFAAQDVEEYDIGAGLSTAELGLRLRYEIKRELAPYIGVSWTRSVGRTADFARGNGEDVSSTSLVAGVRLWF
ncbi:MAG: copper resistance protein B [Alphaproteobacteria bacterium HGW-Alphaproteobacteria-5]|nr:MAG: copper resistance protein B [Alphaproteobacteria bacterium HGW-Alphaproteobacteria-5]